MNPGEQDDIVISTRIRLARNLDDFLFPSKLDAATKTQIGGIIKDALDGCEPALNFTDMSALSHLQAVSLAERHIISPEFTVQAEGTGLLLSEDESVSIMLCEEDHIRLQVMKPGLDLNGAYEEADSIDNKVDGKVNYAFDDGIGYLTSSPSNLGTAMRASVFLHLPALTENGRISDLANTVSKLGLSISGVYGKRSSPIGDIYQISNRLTLGITEQTAISNLQSIVMQLIAQEKTSAQRLLEDTAGQDRVFRALGILKNARVLGGTEFMQLISLVRCCVAGGLIDIPIEKINTLIIEMQPATLSVTNSSIETVAQRDIARAEAVRNSLSQ